MRDEQQRRKRDQVHSRARQNAGATGRLLVKQQAHIGALAFGSEREKWTHDPSDQRYLLDPRTAWPAGTHAEECFVGADL